MQSHSTALIAISLLASASVVLSDNRADIKRQYHERMTDLEQQVVHLTADNACVSDCDCDAIAFGSKACGGPTTYLPYAKTTTDIETLEAKVTAFNRLQADYNRTFGIMSNCMLVTKPAVRCLNDACRAD